MKALITLVLVSGICLAYAPDEGPRVGGPAAAPGTDDWVITLTTVTDVSMSWGGQLRGCDYSNEYSELLVSDFDRDSIYSVDPATGTKIYGIACPPQIPDVLGICAYSDASANYLYINDWMNVLDIWEFSTVTGWSMAFPNPSGGEPRGMDMDDALTIWEIEAAGRVLYHFDLSGSILDSFALPELPASYACGCSVFPFPGGLGIVIGGYAYGDFYFYVFSGGSLEFLGSAPVPQTATSSYGITYNANDDSFFWVYNTSGGFRLCQFTADFQEVALEQNTWGAIKATF